MLMCVFAALSRRCDKSGNDVRVLDRTSFIPGTTQLDTYWGAMALLHDGVGVEVCPIAMEMKSFVRLGPTFDRPCSGQTLKCFVRAAKRAALEYNIEHAVLLSEEISNVVNVNTRLIQLFSDKHVQR